MYIIFLFFSFNSFLLDFVLALFYFSQFSADFLELSNELICSLELGSVIKFSLSLLFYFQWILENLWSSFISIRLQFQ